MTYRTTHELVLQAWREGGQSTRAVAEAFDCSMRTARDRVNAALAHEARIAARVRASNAAVTAATSPTTSVSTLVPPRTELSPHAALRAVRAHGGDLTSAAAELKVHRSALRCRVAEALRIPETAVTARLLQRLPPLLSRPEESATDWRDDAACLSVDPEVFFPTSEQSTAQVKAAKAVCATCPVIDECRTWALDTHQDYGVWGGTTRDERRSLRRRKTAARTHNTSMTEEVA